MANPATAKSDRPIPASLFRLKALDRIRAQNAPRLSPTPFPRWHRFGIDPQASARRPGRNLDRREARVGQVAHEGPCHAGAHLLDACIGARALHARHGTAVAIAGPGHDFRRPVEAQLGEMLFAAFTERLPPLRRVDSASRTCTITGPSIASQRADRVSPSVTPTIRQRSACGSMPRIVALTAGPTRSPFRVIRHQDVRRTSQRRAMTERRDSRQRRLRPFLARAAAALIRAISSGSSSAGCRSLLDVP